MSISQKPENLPESLFHSFGNGYTKSSLIAMSESLLDSATQSILDSDVLVKLPIVGGVVAVGKGVLDFRDRQFVSKLMRVLAETSEIKPKKFDDFRAELAANSKMMKQAGEVLLDLIDKATGTEKAGMIGKVVHAKIEEGFSFDEMIGLCEMIQKAYISDLKALGRQEGAEAPRWNDANLESVGIKKPMRVEEINKAIDAAIRNLRREMPVVREKPLPVSLEKPRVYESGLTDSGAMLRRILQSY